MKFKLLNFPVEIKPFFLLIIALIGGNLYRGEGLTGLFSWLIVATVAILAHELGHALWARWFGAKPSIELNGFGGVCKWQNFHPFSPKQDLVISLAGPFTGLALGLISYIVLMIAHKNNLETVVMIATFSVYCNVFWSLLNLIPILPMDGGQAMRSIIKILKGQHEERLPLQISYYIATALAIVSFFVLNLWILAIFLGYFAYINHRQYKMLSSQTWM